MEENVNSWKMGEIASFPWTSSNLKKSGSTFYKHFYSSKYMCIREEDGGHRGILLKVLGRTSARDITMVGGEPFCKDEKEEMLAGKTYTSFRFPTLNEVIEVLEILRDNPKVCPLLEENSMHLNPAAPFWVRETSTNLLLRKKPQFYDPNTTKLSTSPDATLPPYRITLLYFYKGELIL